MKIFVMSKTLNLAVKAKDKEAAARAFKRNGTIILKKMAREFKVNPDEIREIEDPKI